MRRESGARVLRDGTALSLYKRYDFASDEAKQGDGFAASFANSSETGAWVKAEPQTITAAFKQRGRAAAPRRRLDAGHLAAADQGQGPQWWRSDNGGRSKAARTASRRKRS